MMRTDVGTPRVLAIKLDTGDELEVDAGRDHGAARARLAAFYGDLETHKFVLFDDDTIVRSSQIAFMQLRETGQSVGRTSGSQPRTGGSRMSMYGTEREGSAVRVSGMGDGASTRRSQPLFDVGRGRDRGSETKPFFLTSEFLTTLAVVIGLAIAMNNLDNFNADRGWLLITAAVTAYVVSRGIAKAGSRSYTDDPRDRIGWGDGDR